MDLHQIKDYIVNRDSLSSSRFQVHFTHAVYLGRKWQI